MDDALAPDNEIEFTPEMIEVGALELYKYHPETGESDEDTVISIYRTMHRASEIGS